MIGLGGLPYSGEGISSGSGTKWKPVEAASTRSGTVERHAERLPLTSGIMPRHAERLPRVPERASGRCSEPCPWRPRGPLPASRVALLGTFRIPFRLAAYGLCRAAWRCSGLCPWQVRRDARGRARGRLNGPGDSRGAHALRTHERARTSRGSSGPGWWWLVRGCMLRVNLCRDFKGHELRAVAGGHVPLTVCRVDNAHRAHAANQRPASGVVAGVP